MIPVSPAPAAPALHSARPALAAGGGAASFAVALTALLLPGEAVPMPDVAPEPGVPGRQIAAATGKNLPDDEPAVDKDESDAGGKDGADVAFAWFGMAPPMETSPIGIPVPRAPHSPPAPRVDATIRLPALRLPGAELAHAGLDAVPRAAEPALSAEPVPPPLPAALRATVSQETLTAVAPQLAPAPVAAQPVVPAANLSPRTLAPTEPAGPAAAPLVAVRASGTSAPQSIEVPLATPKPAFEPIPVSPPVPQLLAAPDLRLQPQLAPQPLAATTEAPAPRRAAPRDAAIAIVPTATGEPARPPLVAAAAETQHAPLDLRRHEWMGAMLDRIEAMRDSGGVRETSIRLAPDSLGSLDISIRQEGDRIHVRFASDNPAARAALSDAQPRLAELAEARGLRLGQTSVDAGAGQGSQRHPAATPTLAPAPASARREPESDPDQRIA